MSYSETSEELTDWDEEFESCDEDDIQAESLHQLGDPFANYYAERRKLIKPTLEQAKQTLINCLTRQFWASFQRYPKQNWGPPEVMSGVQHEEYTLSRSILNTLNPKRVREDDDIKPCNLHNDEVRGPKRLRATPSVSELPDEGTKFACPYRKHNPRRAHLYRHHRVHQCQRCKRVFNSPEDLDTHFEAIQGCEVKDGQTVDGVTGKIKERLQSRKKAYPGQTETDRWREVYQILFPNEEVPSPYFEPIRDHHESDIQLPALREVANFEDYFRRELPRFFQAALESAVSHEMQPIEERLRGKMLSVLEEAQKLAFSKYRSMMGPAAISPQISSFLEGEIHPLTVYQNPKSQKEAENASVDTDPPSSPPSSSDPKSVLSFPALDNSQTPEMEHDHSNTTERIAPENEGYKDLKINERNSVKDSSSISQSTAGSPSDTDRSLPLPNDEVIGDNTTLNFSDGADNITLFSNEWDLNQFTFDPSLLNWSPSLEITSATQST